MRRNLIMIIFLLLFVTLGCVAALLINEPVELGGIGQAIEWGWWR